MKLMLNLNQKYCKEQGCQTQTPERAADRYFWFRNKSCGMYHSRFGCCKAKYAILSRFGIFKSKVSEGFSMYLLKQNLTRVAKGLQVDLQV